VPYIKVSALMRYYIDGQPEALVAGETVVEALQDAVGRYPALKFHLFDSEGNLRRHIHVFINDRNIRDLEGLKSKLLPQDRVILLSSISGGARACF
jgi:molybdopterin converting factor small subunit